MDAFHNHWQSDIIDQNINERRWGGFSLQDFIELLLFIAFI